MTPCSTAVSEWPGFWASTFYPQPKTTLISYCTPYLVLCMVIVKFFLGSFEIVLLLVKLRRWGCLEKFCNWRDKQNLRSTMTRLYGRQIHSRIDYGDKPNVVTPLRLTVFTLAICRKPRLQAIISAAWPSFYLEVQ